MRVVTDRKPPAGRKGEHAAARLPGSASSLMVKESKTSGGAVRNGSVAPTDVQLLTSSILGNKTRQHKMLEWQERLINLGAHSQPVTLDELKRALTYLSPSSWLQVLQERYLAGECPYPTCPNQAPQPLPASKSGKYRISLSRKEVYPNTADRPGHRDTFCSDTCFARSQWIRTWVLKDLQDSDDDDLDHNLDPAPSAHSATTRPKTRKNNPPVNTDRVRLHEEHSHQLELLEDLQLDPEYADMLGALSKSTDKSSSPCTPTTIPQLNPNPNPNLLSCSIQLNDKLNSLVIRERTPGTPQPNAATWSQDVPATPSDHIDTLAIARLDLRATLTRTRSKISSKQQVDPDPITLPLIEQGLRARDEQRRLGLL